MYFPSITDALLKNKPNSITKKNEQETKRKINKDSRNKKSLLVSDEEGDRKAALQKRLAESRATDCRDQGWPQGRDAPTTTMEKDMNT